MSYLLDTNVISETRRKRPDRQVVDFFGATDSSSIFLSILTPGEIRKGVVNLIDKDPEGAARLAAWVDGLEYSFADRLLGVDSQIVRIWAEISGKRPRPVVDSLIAATAIHHDLTMVTRNLVDFSDTNVKILNPWATTTVAAKPPAPRSRR
jgi:predicted nucleic acid-binding protein